MTSPKRAKRPPIHMIDTEADTLTELALAKQEQLPLVCQLLLGEIDRATIRRAAAVPDDVVTMKATVSFVDETGGARRTVQIVYPGDADISAGRISILTPIGAGLIGLRIGQSITWPDRDGREHILTIVEVQRPVLAADKLSA